MNYHKKTLRPWRFTSAFTLVELMVVLAIIAMLMMMVIPNVRKHRARARSAQCQNNLRQYGVAMNQYMADNSGYFVRPSSSSGISATRVAEGIDISGYQRGVVESGSTATTMGRHSAHSWRSLVSYVPAPGITDINFLRSGQASARICPDVNRNVFDPKHSDFKGLHEFTDSGLKVSRPDFFGGVTDTPATDLILNSSFTTYAINEFQTRKLLETIPGNVVAFIDANAEEGLGCWGSGPHSYLHSGNRSGKWGFTGRARYGNPVEQGDSKMPLKGTTNWWHTEIGFYHPGTGTNMTANYVAMDGSVHAISYAEISVTNFTGL